MGAITYSLANKGESAAATTRAGGVVVSLSVVAGSAFVADEGSGLFQEWNQCTSLVFFILLVFFAHVISTLVAPSPAVDCAEACCRLL